MKITVYELMGLIEEKKAPYEITYKGTKYYLDDLENYYRTDGNTPLLESIFDTYNDYYALQEKVVISEENDEWEDIEQLEQIISSKAIYDNYEDITKDIHNIVETIDNLVISFNQLIKNQKYLKERLDSKDES